MDFFKESQEKVKFIQANLLATNGKQKEYMDHTVRDLYFKVAYQVSLKVSPVKGVMRFDKRSKIFPQ